MPAASGLAVLRVGLPAISETVAPAPARRYNGHMDETTSGASAQEAVAVGGSGRVRDRELFSLVTRCVREAHDQIRRMKAERGWIPSILHYPSLSTFDSGWPNVTHSPLGSNVPHYQRVFGLKASDMTPVGVDDIPTLRDLIAYARNNERLFEVLRLPNQPPSDDRLFTIQVGFIVWNVIDRVLHVYGNEFTDADLEHVYSEYEMGLLERELPIDIVVPIALTPFAIDGAVAAGEDAVVERMSDDFQLARVPESQYGAGAAASPVVVGAATHAAVFSGYVIKNDNPTSLRWDLLRFYPLERIDRFFTALRIVTGLYTGYVQICMRPRGWARDWVPALPPVIKGATGRRYPPWFDDWGWLAKPPEAVTPEQLRNVAEVDDQLAKAPTQIALAGRRLSAAMLREHEDDSIIDLCIGLEAVLGDQSRMEITHKLALRTAAVLAAAKGAAPVEVFRHVKGIYAYRSAVVHGTAPAKKRQLPTADGGTVLAVDAAQDFLSGVLRAVLARPEWRKPEAVDDALVVGALATLATATDDGGPDVADDF